MKNRLIITISDHKGTKSFNLHKLVKQIALFSFLCIVALIIGAIYFIKYLNNEIGTIETTKKEEIKRLEIKEQKLITQNRLNSLKIKDTLNDLEELSSTLEEIEEIIGIKNEEKLNPIKRVEVAKMTLVEKMRLLRIVPNGKPLESIIITANFGTRKHPITKKKQFHRGLDLRAKRKTPIYATADGVVKYVQSKNIGNYGRMIIISHNYGFETVFAHLLKTKVKIGDIVNKGDIIGLTGNSGRSTGPHLHYEVRFASRVFNPKSFIQWDLKNYETIFKKENRIPWESLINLMKKQQKNLGQQ